jgi:hypothetical protein
VTNEDALIQRTQRAQAALADGSWRIEPVTPNQWQLWNGKPEPYLITLEGETWDCSCPDVPPAGVPCKHIIGVQMTLEPLRGTRKGRRESHNGGNQMLQYEELKTLTGIPVTELPQKLDEQLPPDAYSAVPGRVDLTDIDANHMKAALNRIFGLAGIGWGYKYRPEDVKVIPSVDDKGRPEATAIVRRLDFWFALVNGGDPERFVIPASGASKNFPVQYALKGAISNAIGNAVSHTGFQESVYLGKRDHRTVNGKSSSGAAAVRRPAAAKSASATKPAAPQPAPDGASDDPAEFVISFGVKHAGKKLGDISAEALTWYAEKMVATTEDAKVLQAKAKAMLAKPSESVPA